MTPVLELRNITKRFPGVLANDHISLTLEKGEIHALLGENGAGKTTLMNILYGLYQPDEGQIFVKGKEVKIHSPSDAIASGVGMVHQHFMLIPVFTVTENVMLGSEPTRPGGFLDRKKAAAEITEISTKYCLAVDPTSYIKDIPVGVQQRVEIIKLLYRKAEILILDEPTAVLTPQEADELFKIMHALTKQGKSIIFITHKLREVLDCADRITVIRRGKVIGTTTPKEANQAKLATMMVGREVMLEVEKSPAKPKEIVLQTYNLQVADDRHQIAVEDVSFDVHKGEILGIAGVQGNGQTELVESLTGLRQLISGHFEINGKPFGKKIHVSHKGAFIRSFVGVALILATIFLAIAGFQKTWWGSLTFIPWLLFFIFLFGAASFTIFYSNKGIVRKITELGTAHIPEDRQRDGLVLPFPVQENLVLCSYYLPPYAKWISIQWKTVKENAVKLIKQFDIRTPNEETPVSALSGGNQQKVIVARELSRPIDLLIAAQPTRGLDVGSIEYIHSQIIKKRDEGIGVLLVSTELDEIMQLSDRIAIMYRGRIVATVTSKESTKEYVGLMMAGIPQDQAYLQIFGKEFTSRKNRG